VAGKKKSQDRVTSSKPAARAVPPRTVSRVPEAKPGASPWSEMDTTEKVVWVSLHVLIFLVPLAMTNANWIAAMFKSTAFGQFWALPLTYDQFDIAKVFVMRACAIVGMGAWSFTFFWRGGKLRRTKLDWFIVAILGWVLLTSFTSISLATAIFGKYRRFEGFLSFLTYAAVFFLTVQVVDRPSRIRSVARTLVISAMIVAFYGLLQYTGHDPVNWGANLPFEANRSFASYGNPDLLGGFLIFPLSVSLGMALTEVRLRWRVTYWIAFGLVVACWVTAFTRGAWIGGAVALVVLVIAAIIAKVPAFSPKEPTGQVDIAFGGLAAVAAAAVVGKSLTTTSDVMNVWSRLRSIFEIASGSGRTRTEIWQAAWDAIRARPLFGWGADTFRLVFPKFKPAVYTVDAGYLSVADNVHDYPLQVTSALGVPGFLLLYGTFGYALFLGFKQAFVRDRGAERIVVAAFWAAALGYVTHLMFGLSVTGTTIFLWLSLAIIVTPGAWIVEHKGTGWGQALAAGFAALALVLSVLNVVYIVADHYYLESNFGSASGDSGVAAAKIAITLNPYNDMYRTQLGQAYQGQMLAYLGAARQAQAAGQDATLPYGQAKLAFQLSEQSMNDAIAFVPTEYDNYNFLASLYNQGGAYFDAKYYNDAWAIAQKGIAVEPYGPAVRVQGSIALASLGRFDEAIAVAKAAAVMDPNYTEPFTMLGDLYRQKGSWTEAETWYAKALAAKPDDAQAKDGLTAVEASAAAASATAK
jgi:O-antigen ligase/predicted negative regulator of RcsB-dependent stress response